MNVEVSTYIELLLCNSHLLSVLLHRREHIATSEEELEAVSTALGFDAERLKDFEALQYNTV